MHPAITTALRRLDTIRAAYYAGRIDHAEHHRRTRATWAEIERRPRLYRAVCAEIAKRATEVTRDAA